MSVLKWREVKAGLAAQPASREMPGRGKEEFWSDFSARARMVCQEASVAETRMTVGVRLRWAYAAAACLVIGLAVWFPFRRTSSAANPIRALEVVAPHTGVIIMQDQNDQGTILWIAGLDLNSTG